MKCLNRQQVKIEHRRQGGQLNSLLIPKWKWEKTTIDFVQGLPRTSKGHDAIQVIIDQLTKSAHFLLVKIDFSMDRLAYFTFTIAWYTSGH